MKTLLNKEVNYIKNDDIREIVECDLEKLPDYFWVIPALTSGKYHPKASLREGGLVRHTKTAVEVAMQLFPLYDFNEETKDIIIASLILHDGFKCGLDGSEYTAFEHPLIMSQLVFDAIDIDNHGTYRLLISRCIASHMGQWNTNNRSSIVLPLPLSEPEKFVHMCDYIASRRKFNIELSD